MEFPFVLITSLSAGFLAQGIKIALKMRKRSVTFTPELLDAYGGMPSAHSAFLISLLTSILLKDGIGSTSFGIAGIMAAIMIRDALGFRMILEEHGVTISRLASELHKRHPTMKDGAKYRIGHRVGHTVPEVIVGAAIGMLFAVGMWFGLQTFGVEI